MTRNRFAIGALALSLTLALGACSGGDAQSGAQSAVEAAPQSGPHIPEVDRSGEGNFPEVTGAFGEDPEISAGKGDAPAKVSVKTLVAGAGAEIVTADSVVVNYELALWDGKKVESSFEQGKPASFALNKVIPGWTYGLSGQHVGDRVEIVVPAEWGYGDQGNSSIPGGSTLVFVIDVLNSTSNAKADEGVLAQSTPTGAALPEGVSVAGDPGKEPTVTIAEGATPPTERSQTEVFAGRGPTVAAGDQVLIREVDAVFGDASKTMSSWAQEPIVVPSDALTAVGKNVGSRLVYVVPTGQQVQSGQSAQMMVAVVDIVGVMKADGSTN